MADLFSALSVKDPKNAYFQKLLDQGMDQTPISSNWQGASRLANSLLAGLMLGSDEADKEKAQALRLNLPGLGPAPAASASPVAAALASDPSRAIQSGPDMSLPRGIRNNNPLNIEAGDFTKGQPGFTGSDGRFARFDTPDSGMAATNKLLDTYQNKYGLNTVSGIINRWAPPGENDSRGYAASVAGGMGVSPDQPLTPDQRPALIAAMGQFENGRPIKMAQAQPTGDATLLPNSAPAAGFAVPGGQQQPSGTAPYQRAPI